MNRALHRTIKLRFELGLFDPIEDQPYWHASPDIIGILDWGLISTISPHSPGAPPRTTCRLTHGRMLWYGCQLKSC